MRGRLTTPLLVALTALPRLAVVLHERDRILTAFTDKSDNFAQTFLSSGTFGFITGHPSAYTQPLYGWFLIPIYWVFGRSWLAVGLAQTLVACCTTLIVWQIGKRFLSAAAGLLAGIAVALHPYLVWHDVHMNREILDHLLAACIVFLTLLALQRLGVVVAVALGAVLGLAILGNVRLEALPFVVGAYLLWHYRRRAIVPLAALLVAAAVVVIPYVIRNDVNVGCATITTDAKALWKANNVNTLRTLEHGGWIDHVPIPASFPKDPNQVYEHWLATENVLPYSECAQMSFYEHRVFQFWKKHPVEKLHLAAFDARWLWQPSVVETRGRPGAGGALDTLRSSAEPAYMIPLYILGAIGLFLVPRALAALAVLLLGYQTAVAALFVGETRYRVPWDFVIALLASAALLQLVARFRPAARGLLPSHR